MTAKPAWLDADGNPVPGIYRDIRDNDYQTLEAVRGSVLMAALDCAKALKCEMESPTPETTALREGRALHVHILQPQHAHDEIVFAPDEFVTKKGRKLSDGIKAKAWVREQGPAVTVVTDDEWERIGRYAKTVHAHAGAQTIFAECHEREITAIWYETLPDGRKLACKARADMLGPTTLADLKGWVPKGEFSRFRFGVEIHNRRYHAKLGWYERGFIKAAIQADIDCPCTFDNWSFVVVGKSRHVDVLALDADADMMDVGRAMAREAWETYASAVAADEWPGVDPGRGEVSLPPWSFDKSDWEAEKKPDFDAMGLTGTEAFGGSDEQ